MKRILIFLLLMILTVPFAGADTAWQDQTLPLEQAASATVLYKVDHDKHIVNVGEDIPAGLYSVSGFCFENSPALHVQYMIYIMRGVETIYKSSLLDTEKNADLIIPLFDGDTLIIAPGLTNIVYLYSVDFAPLKVY